MSSSQARAVAALVLGAATGSIRNMLKVEKEELVLDYNGHVEAVIVTMESGIELKITVRVLKDVEE